MPTFQSLYEDNRDALRLSWIAGQGSSSRPLATAATAGLASADLVGHLNLIHPNRLHVLGDLLGSELGKALGKALAKAKAGAEALTEAETLNSEIQARLG